MHTRLLPLLVGIAAAAAFVRTAPAAGDQQIQIIRGAAGQELPPFVGSMGLTGEIPRGSSVIVGRVLDAGNAGSRQPVPGAIVTLAVPGARPLRVMADGQGQFAFRNLPAGSFHLSAEKPGYLAGAFGQLRPSGPAQAVELADGEHAPDVTLPLWKFAVVSGAVTDEIGEPVVGVAVQALIRRFVSGRPRFTPGPGDVTDDRGFYRISSLEPGTYLIAVVSDRGMQVPLIMSANAGNFTQGTWTSAGPAQAISYRFGPGVPGAGRSDAGISADGTRLTYPTLFYPGSWSASGGAPLSLESGEERSGIDFSLTPAPARRVAGSIAGPGGSQAGVMVTLMPVSDQPQPWEAMAASTDDAGAFVFGSVPAGQYRIRAVRSSAMMIAGGVAEARVEMRATTVQNVQPLPALPPNFPPGTLPPGAAAASARPEPLLWGETIVSVGDEDIDGIPIVLREGARVSGTLEFDGGSARPDAARIPPLPIWLEPVNPDTAGVDGTARGSFDANGRFTVENVLPGKYFVRAAGMPPAWRFRGATLAGRDISDMPFEVGTDDITGIAVTFTDQETEISGEITGAKGPAGSTASVVVFPTEPDRWVDYGRQSRQLVTVRADRQGRYRVSGLPRGSYYIAAILDTESADWQDPEYLDLVTGRATVFQIDEGHSLRIPLTLP